ncbi:hypothetical protein ACFE04_016652 [Oxalis oulophora]
MAFDCTPNGQTISVDQSGKGNYVKIQDAIDSVSIGNNQWITINISSGNFMEKVTIEKEKSCIVLQGGGLKSTYIKWGDHYDTLTSYTFSTEGENIVVKGITFVNTYDAPNLVAEGPNVSQAVAVLRCSIRANAGKFSSKVGYGFITAHRRNSDKDPGGFVFKYCTFGGNLKSYLGRPWGAFARVFVYSSYISDIIFPEGWFAGNHPNETESTTFVESNNSGPGANSKYRVAWRKTMTDRDLLKFVDTATWISQDGWLKKMPIS